MSRCAFRRFLPRSCTGMRGRYPSAPARLPRRCGRLSENRGNQIPFADIDGWAIGLSGFSCPVRFGLYFPFVWLEASVVNVARSEHVHSSNGSDGVSEMKQCVSTAFGPGDSASDRSGPWI